MVFTFVKRKTVYGIPSWINWAESVSLTMQYIPDVVLKRIINDIWELRVVLRLYKRVKDEAEYWRYLIH